MFKTRTLVLCLLAVHGVGGEANFNPLQHSGPASPYFDAPSQDGIPTETPPGCRVDQAAYILRHGSRYPEPGSFQGWVNLFNKFQNASYTARGPLAFIPSWVPPVDDLPHEPPFLTSTGAGEAFSLGVDLRKRYGFTKGGTDFTIWSASQQRVLDTGAYFLRGYLSQGSYNSDLSLNRGFTISLPDSVNNTFADSLTPSTSFPLYTSGDRGSAMASQFRATYLPNIARRLNQHFLDGLVLDPVDVGIMQDLCGFSAEINGDTRFCNIFEPSEWLDYEYAHDLNYYYGSGPGNPFSATVGFPWVKAITDIFVAGPGRSPTGASATPPPLMMGFTHDNNLPPIISALGVWNTSKPRGAPIYPLSPTTPNPERMFRSSFLVAFRGYVALERLACDNTGPAQEVKHVAGTAASDKGNKPSHFVRIRVDNAPVPIPGCTDGPGATCSLSAFVKHVNTQGRVAGDFVDRCGLSGVPGATSRLQFLTNQPMPASVIPLPS
ncbi:histidine acid phosphatase family protein [Pleurotus pulmonarius]